MTNCNYRMKRSSCYEQMPDSTSCASGQELAMAYVPWQQFRELYEPDQALRYGTMFQELHKPFHGGMGGRL